MASGVGPECGHRGARGHHGQRRAVGRQSHQAGSGDLLHQVPQRPAAPGGLPTLTTAMPMVGGLVDHQLDRASSARNQDRWKPAVEPGRHGATRPRPASPADGPPPARTRRRCWRSRRTPCELVARAARRPDTSRPRSRLPAAVHRSRPAPRTDPGRNFAVETFINSSLVVDGLVRGGQGHISIGAALPPPAGRALRQEETRSGIAARTQMPTTRNALL